MTIVTNAYGKEIDLDQAANIMDAEIANAIDADTDQEWFDLYCKTHLEKYGEEFECDKENPVW